jgi:hypothetical protein
MNGNGNVGFGVNVWWTCPEVIREGSDVQTALQKHGFEKSDIPFPSRRTEVSRAAYSFQNRLGKSNRRVTEKANDNVNFVTYGILDREQEEADTVGFTQHTTIRLDKSTNEVKVDGSLASEVMDSIKTYSGKMTDDDIRYFLRRVIKMCFGVAKRPTGGIYFVPEQFTNVVRSAQAVLDELGTGAKLYVEGVVNGVQERQNVWASVEEEIDGRIQETLSAVDRIERRTNCIKDQEEKLNGVKSLMEVYVKLLGEEAKYQGIAEKIEKAVKTVAEKMAVVQKGTAAVKKAKKVKAVVVPVEEKVEPLKKAAMPPPPKATCGANGVKFTNDALRFVHEILTEKGVPMNYGDLAKEALAKGLVLNVKDAAVSMYNYLNASLKKGEGLFVKTGRGMFDIVRA